jgi:hypothetical protein
MSTGSKSVRARRIHVLLIAPLGSCKQRKLELRLNICISSYPASENALENSRL